MKRKIINFLILGLMPVMLIGCNASENNKKAAKENVIEESSTVSESKNEEENKEIDLLNPFNLEELALSEQIVNLDGWGCKTQMDTLETCRLLLSTNHNKSEESFSFLGYVYEEGTNIPDGIFIDNSGEITNNSVYAVGLVSGKEGEEKFEANPKIAQYKYVKTSENSAVISKLDNTPIGTVQEEYAITINERIDKFKEMIKNK